ncbi:MAG: hypothetical protein HOK61_07395 [Alphaproteobacteria bacterium]|nr:hypothetical protein [Alphaproteobacteria bacterium]
MTDLADTQIEATDLVLGADNVPAAKERQCLKCREEFPSEWAGERICKRCKSSGSWRNGSA